jgi:hypothetical protein
MHSVLVVAHLLELGKIIYWEQVEVMEFCDLAIRSIRLEVEVRQGLGQVIPTRAVKVVQHLSEHLQQMLPHSILVRVEVVVLQILVVV